MCVCVCECVRAYVCAHARVYVCVCASVRARVYVCVRVRDKCKIFSSGCIVKFFSQYLYKRGTFISFTSDLNSSRHRISTQGS